MWDGYLQYEVVNYADEVRKYSIFYLSNKYKRTAQWKIHKWMAPCLNGSQ